MSEATMALITLATIVVFESVIWLLYTAPELSSKIARWT